ncbi:MAG TPA: hypothetical protein VL967_08810 [Terracidiphilus sp.]|nr:hypothetical protein [Terracidiphilus sp.]
MNQQLRSDPRDLELTTADLAKTSEPISTDPDSERDTNRVSRTTRNQADGEFDRSADRSPYRPAVNPFFERDDPPFSNEPDQVEEQDWRKMKSANPPTDSTDDSSLTAPLFSTHETNDFHARWDAVQVGFVDEPRRAVQEADGLVASAIQRLAQIFADERAKLDKQWDRGDAVSTEDLRLALRRYRSFFGRLLSI